MDGGFYERASEDCPCILVLCSQPHGDAEFTYRTQDKVWIVRELARKWQEDVRLALRQHIVRLPATSGCTPHYTASANGTREARGHALGTNEHPIFHSPGETRKRKAAPRYLSYPRRDGQS
jgi:hypothetical protein